MSSRQESTSGCWSWALPRERANRGAVEMPVYKCRNIKQLRTQSRVQPLSNCGIQRKHCRGLPGLGQGSAQRVVGCPSGRPRSSRLRLREVVKPQSRDQSGEVSPLFDMHRVSSNIVRCGESRWPNLRAVGGPGPLPQPGRNAGPCVGSSIVRVEFGAAAQRLRDGAWLPRPTALDRREGNETR